MWPVSRVAFHLFAGVSRATVQVSPSIGEACRCEQQTEPVAR